MCASKANKIYIANVMTQPGETSGYTLADHVQAIIDHGGEASSIRFLPMMDLCQFKW